jgi:hypothetical protein
VFAFVGTTLSAAIIGLILWGCGLPATAMGDGFTLLEAMIFVRRLSFF